MKLKSLILVVALSGFATPPAVAGCFAGVHGVFCSPDKSTTYRDQYGVKRSCSYNSVAGGVICGRSGGKRRTKAERKARKNRPAPGFPHGHVRHQHGPLCSEYVGSSTNQQPFDPAADTTKPQDQHSHDH